MQPVKFSEIEEGKKYTFTKKITQEDLNNFVAICKDRNPIHVNDDYAKQTPFNGKIVHGMLTSSLISTVIGINLPGSVWLDQSFKFLKPVRIDDTITATAEVLVKI